MSAENNTSPTEENATSADESAPVESAEVTSPQAPAVETSEASPAASTPALAEGAAPAENAAPAEGAAHAEGAAPADSGSPNASAAEPGGEEGDAPKRKRRRRRRKKKSGEHAAAGESAPPVSKERRSHDKKPATDRTPFHVGEEVFGKVTSVVDEAIMVDLSGKALGIFDRREMEADDLVPSEGDRFVARVQQDGARGGLILLTRKPLREEAVKPQVEQASKDGTLVEGLITGVIKGGVDVSIDGLRAFAPASGMDLHPQNANFASLVGLRLQFKVTSYEKNGRDVVITRRPMLENEAHERRKRALGLLEEGRVMGAIARTIVDWGVFVALPEAENLEGLVHASEASHDPRMRLSELFKPGEKFDVKITKIDEKGKIWLSRKALIPDPWKEAKEKYPPGTKLKTTITNVENFGAFCQLDGVQGLIHVADLSPTRVEDINAVVKPGDEMDVVVHNFDLKNHKVALHPALTGDQAEETPQKVGRNANLDVEVLKAEPAGVTVRVLGVTGRAARGFIPAGQTGTERGSDLRKHFKTGQKLKVAVLDLDPRRGEPKLSIRRFAENEERNAHRDYKKKLADEGGFGTLGDLLAKRLGR